jgi:hypothetical protein
MKRNTFVLSVALVLSMCSGTARPVWLRLPARLRWLWLGRLGL